MSAIRTTAAPQVTSAPARRPAWVSRLRSPLVPVLLFLLLAARDLGLPGLYMDSVNPDYLGVWITQPAGEMPAWIYPDNLLAPGYEVPLLNSLYGGSTPAYVAAAAFKVFGTGLGTVRVLHLAYGVLILLLTYHLVSRVTRSRAAPTVVTGLLVLDASFVYAWRTQYYLQLFPNLFFIAAAVLAARAVIAEHESAWRHRRLLLTGCGALAGFAAYGYFVYALYAVVLLAVILRHLPRSGLLRYGGFYVGGFIVGYLPYLFAHASIIAQEGVSFWLAALRGLQSNFGITDEVGGGLGSKALYTLDRLSSVAGGDQVAEVVLAQDAATEWVGGAVLALALVAIAAGLAALARTTGTHTAARLVLELVAGLLAVQLAFGTLLGSPLQAQHYVALLPWLYIGAGIGVWAIITIAEVKINARTRAHAVGAASSVLALTLLAGTLTLHADLTRTGGRGWYTDGVNRVGSALADLPAGSVAIFPQWGFWMGAAIVDGGRTRMWQEGDLSTVPARIEREPRADFYAVVLTTEQVQAGGADMLAASTGMPLHAQRDVLDRAGRVVARIAVLRGNGADEPPLGPTPVVPGR